MGLTVFQLPLQPLYNVCNAGNLAVSQRLYVLGKRPGRCGVAVFRVKELLRLDAEIVADIKENLHGREGFPVFNLIDIAFALP